MGIQFSKNLEIVHSSCTLDFLSIFFAMFCPVNWYIGCHWLIQTTLGALPSMFGLGPVDRNARVPRGVFLHSWVWVQQTFPSLGKGCSSWFCVGIKIFHRNPHKNHIHIRVYYIYIYTWKIHEESTTGKSPHKNHGFSWNTEIFARPNTKLWSAMTKCPWMRIRHWDKT